MTLTCSEYAIHRAAGRSARVRRAAAAVALSVLAAASGSGQTRARPAPTPAPATAAELFRPTRVWNIHLKLTADAWAEMEPSGFGPPGGPGGPGGPFGGPPGGGPFGPGGPGPGDGPGPQGGPTPAMLLVPLLMQHGDVNRDGALSADEFQGLAVKWWTAWDRRKAGHLTFGEVRDGLRSAFMEPGPGDMEPGPGTPRPQGGQGRQPVRRGIPFQYVHADMFFEGKRFADVGLRYKGNNTYMASQGQLKRPLKIEINRHVEGQKLAGVSKLNLHNNVNDGACMNECLAYRAFRDAGVPGPRTAYARVYLTVPGTYAKKYLGLYTLVEDIDKNFAEANFGTRKGAIFKPVTQTLFGYMGDAWPRYEQVYDPKSSLTQAQQQWLTGFCKFATNADDATFAARIGDYVDLDEFAAYMAVAVGILDQDSLLDMGQNLYLHLDPKTEKLAFIPWDQDHSWGQFPLSGTPEDREQLSIWRPWIGSKPFLERIFKVEAFRMRYLANLRKLSTRLLRPERISAQVEEVAAAIRPSIRAESVAMLARFDRLVAGRQAVLGGEPGFGPGPGPGGPPGMGAVKPIKPFIEARAASLAVQLAGLSQGRVPRFGFGGPGGPGGGPGDPGGDFGPWSLLTPALLRQMAPARLEYVTREEFMTAFSRWYTVWSEGRTADLTPPQLQVGVDRMFELALPGPGGPPFDGGPGG